MRSIAATTARLGAAVILLALHAAPLDEQYFGRNKVRGEKFDFRVLQSPHFDIYHYSAESTATADGLNWLVGAVHIPYLIGSLADVTVWRRPQSFVGFPSALCWRRSSYLFVRPITVAVRGLHYGRYGANAERSDWLQSLFLGYGSPVRGYCVESFSAAERTPVSGNTSACPTFDRPLGSRIAVASVELRIALVGPKRSR